MSVTSNIVLLAVVYDLPYSYRLRESFPHHIPEARLNICRTPEEALLYLRGVGIYQDRHLFPLPDLLLLDTVNSPHGQDRSVLTFCRQESDYAALPIVMLVENPDNPALQKDLDCGANGYVVKRDDFDQILLLLDGIKELKQLKSEKAYY